MEEAIGDPQLGVSDSRIYGVRYSPKGDRIAVNHMGGHISVWDASNAADLKPIHHFQGSRFTYGTIDFSPDGIWLAAGKGSGAVEIYDSYIGDQMLTVGKHENYVYRVQFGPDHTRLVSGGRGVSYLWALDKTDGVEDADPVGLWNQLRGSFNEDPESSTAYQAVLLLGSSQQGREFIVQKIHDIAVIGKPDSLRNQDPASPVRMAMYRKAETDDKFELNRAVHLALVALRLSNAEDAKQKLNQIADSHQSKAVREMAARIK